MTTPRIRSLPVTMLLSIVAAAMLVPMPLPGQAGERVQQVVVSAKRMSEAERRAYDAGLADGRREALQARARPVPAAVPGAQANEPARADRVAAQEQGAAPGRRM